MSSIFARGNKLYASAKGVDGRWKQLSTGCSKGEEEKAERWLADLEQRTQAARAVGATDGPLTVERYSKTWIKGRERLGLDWKNDEQRLRDHVLRSLGSLPLADVRARHLVELFHRIRVAKRIAPKTIRNVYAALSALFRDARIAGLIDQSPCILTEHQLGPLVDKDPTWRGDAVFTRVEVERLISDPSIDRDRQMMYALGALAGLRHGESAGLRWRHYEADKEPLAQLTVATSYDKGATKTGAVRRVPVHPTLAAMLQTWRLESWPAIFGRVPGPEDLIVPLPPDPPNKQARPNPRAGGMRTAKDTGKRWDTDLARLGLRHRRGHDLRATFITLAEEDGADPNVIARVTHTPSKRSAYEGYSRTQWETLCREVAKLRIACGDSVPSTRANDEATAREHVAGPAILDAVLVQSIDESEKWNRHSVLASDGWRSGRDLNPRPPA